MHGEGESCKALPFPAITNQLVPLAPATPTPLILASVTQKHDPFFMTHFHSFRKNSHFPQLPQFIFIIFSKVP